MSEEAQEGGQETQGADATTEQPAPATDAPATTDEPSDEQPTEDQ